VFNTRLTLSKSVSLLITLRCIQPVYLRHCVLAAWNCDSEGSWSKDGVGGIAYNSFLDQTFLVDRVTTIREYINQYPEVMETEPPDSLKERYNG
jgi:hypothetical protein